MRERDGELDTLAASQVTGTAVKAQAWSRVSPALDLDLVQAQAAEPERLQCRLLGGEANGEVAAWPAPRGGKGDLGLAENAAGEGGPALERLLQPLDLEHVDADACRHSRVRLLDRDRLGEVARLVDVEPVQPGDVIGQQLQRQDREDRLQDPIGAWDEKGLIAGLGDL